MRRYQLFFIGSVFAISGAIGACSGDTTPGDGGGPETGPSDAKADKQPLLDAATDAAPPVTPAGTQLAASDQIQIFGVTADDDVIYADGSSAGLYAVAATGGTPTKIAAPSTYIVGIAGKIVFVWASVNQTTSIGGLSIWTHGGTYTAVPNATASSPAVFGSSPDGTHIIFTASAASNVANVIGANADGTSQTTLITGANIAATDCSPIVAFVSNTEVASSTCATAPADGGVPSAAISTFAIAGGGDSGTTWTPASILATGALNFWSTDTAGDKIMVATPAGTSVYPIGGGVPQIIDVKDIFHAVGPTDFTFGRMNAGGTDVLYSTAAGELDTAAVSVTPAPAAVQATGANFIRAISPDGNYTLYTTNFDTQMFGGDLYLTKNIAAAGTPVTLSNVLTSALFGVSSLDDFTGDSSYVLWIENLNTTSGIGDLYGQAVASGTPKMYGSGVWQNASATSTKVVFNNNCGSCSGSGATATAQGDLYVVDVATTAAPTLLQAQVDIPQSASSSIYFDNAKTHTIYAYSLDAPTTGVPANGGNGLYVIALP